MSNPLVHAERAAKRWGGSAADYLPLHQWFDATKGHLSDNRHRMLLHNGFGVLLAEQVFGPTIVNSAGRRVFVRDLGIQHILEDLGFVPTLGECLADLPLAAWMAGGPRAASLRPLASQAPTTSVCDDAVRIVPPHKESSEPPAKVNGVLFESMDAASNG